MPDCLTRTVTRKRNKCRPAIDTFRFGQTSVHHPRLTCDGGFSCHSKSPAGLYSNTKYMENMLSRISESLFERNFGLPPQISSATVPSFSMAKFRALWLVALTGIALLIPSGRAVSTNLVFDAMTKEFNAKVGEHTAEFDF